MGCYALASLRAPVFQKRVKSRSPLSGKRRRLILRGWRRGLGRAKGRGRRCLCFEPRNLRRRNPDQRPDTKARQFALVDELAHDVAAASPSVGELRNRIGPHVVLGQDVAAVGHFVRGPDLGWVSSHARRRAASMYGSK